MTAYLQRPLALRSLTALRSRNLLRPPDAKPQRDEVKAESANLVKAEPVLHGEEIPAEKSWCSWTIEFICRCKRE